MAYSQSDLDRLKSALVSGVLKVRYADGTEVTYRSSGELEAAIARVERELAGVASAHRTTAVGF